MRIIIFDVHKEFRKNLVEAIETKSIYIGDILNKNDKVLLRDHQITSVLMVIFKKSNNNYNFKFMGSFNNNMIEAYKKITGIFYEEAINDIVNYKKNHIKIKLDLIDKIEDNDIIETYSLFPPPIPKN